MKDIYDWLIKGEFLSDNSLNEQERLLYRKVEQEEEDIRAYFQKIGLHLVHGNGYYHFAQEQTKDQLERKIEQARKWIDLMDFFKTFNPSFTAGFRFTISDIVEKLQVDANLSQRLGNLETGNKATTIDQVRHLTKIWASSPAFIALENAQDEVYKVLSSFHYLEELILKIHIDEAIQTDEHN